MPPEPKQPGRGRPAKRLRRDETHQPVSAKALALELDASDWQQITWREGSNTPLSSRFARWRVRPAHDDDKRSEPAAEEWLLIEWPEGETEPDHYWLATLAAGYLVRAHGRPDQDALADRARLSRTQAGGRPRSLRRSWLARLPPSRQSLHRCLRVPDLRKGDDSPLRSFRRLATRGICPSRWLPTQRFCHFAHSGTCRIRLPHCESAWHELSFGSSPAALAAAVCCRGVSSGMSDAVGLRPCRRSYFRFVGAIRIMPRGGESARPDHTDTATLLLGIVSGGLC